MSFRLPRVFATLLLCFLLCASGVASGVARAERIRSFQSVVRANKDASLDVTETIIYDFEGQNKHGIYRDFPISYARNGGTYSLRWKVLGVTDENNAARTYKVEQSGGNLHVRVGDADALISGVQTYVFKFKFWRAVNWFKGAPEVYWNATGTEWQVPIDAATARFYPPAGTDVKQVRTASFVGAQGSATPAQVSVGADSISFSARDLAPHQNLTLVAGLPAGSMVKPPANQSLLWFIADWWSAFAFPLLSLVGMTLLWRARGRDVDGNLPAQVEWSPPRDLTPADVGTLLNERCDMTDILSTLIDLAARGYLVIQDLSTKGAVLGIGAKTDYIFTRTNQQIPLDAPLRQHEKTFLEGLFGTTAPGGQRVTLSSLKNQFYVYLPQIRQSIYRDLTDKNLFKSNPESTRNDYIGAGVVVAGLGLVAIFLGAGFLGSISYGIGLIGAGLVVMLFSGAMPARTALGSRRLRECVGFQRFVQLAEKDRIEKLIGDDPTIFGRLLPYAMVLGVGEIWATKFSGLMQQAPDWYVSNSNGVFMPTLFASNLGSGMGEMGSTFSSQPQSTAGSGGSGFSGGGSGGGFGGGGGGSW